jgi:L-2-hydroxyglutarate oxidase LhgO
VLQQLDARDASPLDVAVVGAGIVGLATARQLQRCRPGLRLVVLEKESDLAAHQSGHNSGVLHAGLYYKPGTMRARLCIEGKREMEEFAAAHGIKTRRCGKLIVAVEERELAPLAALARRAAENGVEGVEEIGPERMREIEPSVRGIRALHSAGTSVIDFREVARALAREIETEGGVILTGRRVSAIKERAGEIVLSSDAGDVVARSLITCAGLHSDRLAAMTGHRDNVRIMPVRGDYYTLAPGARDRVRGLIYPVPDPAYPFLGVHFTRTVHDEVHAGPNAVLALAREGYRRRDVSARDLRDMITFPGFYRMARAHAATGIREGIRDLSRRAFAASLRRYVPEIADDDLVFGPSGVRAQALDRRGRFLDDFSFGGSGRVLHVRNAPSPAATAALAIGRYLARAATEQFGLEPPGR